MSDSKKPKVGFVSLGCPKNLVDSEVMLGTLAGKGYSITAQKEDADVIVVNTCGFIDSAKKESIDTILEMAELKTQGNCKKLVVAGCLAERYRNEIQKEIPEIDFVFGPDELGRIYQADFMINAGMPEFAAAAAAVQPRPASKPDAEAARKAWVRAAREDFVADQTPGSMPGPVDLGAVMMHLRGVLPNVPVPALVLHRRGDRTVPIGRGRELASLLPHGRFVPLNGDSHLPWKEDQRELFRALAGFLHNDTAPEANGASPLSSRETEILRLVATGMSNREIATTLVLSEHTVHRHVANILRKLAQSTRAGAATHAMRVGFI